jgi:hypothetical protein
MIHLKIKQILIFIPIAIIAMIFVTEKDIHQHTKNTCIGLSIYLLVFMVIYLLILKFNCKKWIVILLALILWIILTLLRKKVYK